MKALSFGEILWDIYPTERFIGGAPFNFAAHLARLGAEVCMLSAVGNAALKPAEGALRDQIRANLLKHMLVTYVAE